MHDHQEGTLHLVPMVLASRDHQLRTILAATGTADARRVRTADVRRPCERIVESYRNKPSVTPDRSQQPSVRVMCDRAFPLDTHDGWWQNDTMPRKIRELIRDLERAGFINRGGTGSHRNYHKNGVSVVISGQRGDDAKSYQERDVRRATGGTP